MKSSTTDQVEGKLHELKGSVKEHAGRVTNNPALAKDGQAEKLAGTVQKKIGRRPPTWRSAPRTTGDRATAPGAAAP